MLKKFIISFVVISNMLFATINDERGVFSEKSKVNLNEMIVKIQENLGTTIYLNTLYDDVNIDNQLELNSQKIAVINLIKPKNERQLKIQLKISQDLKTEKISSELSSLLENFSDFVEKNDETIIANTLLEKMNEIIEKNPLPKLEIKEKSWRFVNINVKEWITIGMSILIILIALFPAVIKQCRFFKLAYIQSRSIKVAFALYVMRLKKILK